MTSDKRRDLLLWVLVQLLMAVTLRVPPGVAIAKRLLWQLRLMLVHLLATLVVILITIAVGDSHLLKV